MTSVRELLAADGSELQVRTGTALWELVRIPAGEFFMGSPLSEAGRERGEIPSTLVRITRPFYLGRYQVTQVQYQTVMGENPSRFKGDDLPVDQIRYVDALGLCRRLSDLLGVAVTLPTEAQWEYACRAGTRTRYYSGDTEDALDRAGWYRGNANGTAHPVGRKQPNAWGLFDMLGNLYEPCADRISRFPKPDAADPEGERFPTYGAARGGAWVEPPDRCRAASRIHVEDDLGPVGIRVAINR